MFPEERLTGSLLDARPQGFRLVSAEAQPGPSRRGGGEGDGDHREAIRGHVPSGKGSWLQFLGSSKEGWKEEGGSGSNSAPLVGEGTLDHHQA